MVSGTSHKRRKKKVAKFLGVVLAILIAVGALPAKAQADSPCVPATAEFTIPAPGTFVLPPHTLATLRWADRWSAEIFRVPLGVQVTVINGQGSFRGYSPANCTESQLEWTARDEAWRTGRTVGDINSMPTRLQVTFVGYYPTPSPYVPVPQPVISPPVISVPYPQPAPMPIIFVPPIQSCGPANYTTVDPGLGRVYGAAAIRVTFNDQMKVVKSVFGNQTAFVREAKTIEVWELPGCASNVVGAVVNNLIALAQGGSISFDNAPPEFQSKFSIVRRP